MTPYFDKPCASAGLKSYRCRSPFGWVMIGAKSTAEAAREAFRSTDSPTDLQAWVGFKYVRVASEAMGSMPLSTAGIRYIASQ